MAHLEPAAWTAIGGVASTLAAGWLTIRLEVVKRRANDAKNAASAAKDAAAGAEEKSDRAASAAEQAVILSEPTGNGWAGKVLGALQRLETGQLQHAEALGRTDRRLDEFVDRAERSHMQLDDRLRALELYRTPTGKEPHP